MTTHGSITSRETPAGRGRRLRIAGAAGAASLALSGAPGAIAQSAALPPGDGVVVEEQGGRQREWAATIRWENDTFGGTDRFYTDGVAIAVSHTGPSWLDPVANRLPWGEGRRTVGYDVAQGMFTPEDTDLDPPDPDDRPYAGILAFGLTLHVEKERSYHGLKLVMGVVGPWSLAEETQDAVHDLIGNDKSRGWDHQLENEPIVNLAYEYRHRFDLAGSREKWSLQALPLAGGWLGNMLTQVQLGGLLRLGYNVPDDSGPTLVRAMGHMPPPRRDAERQGRSDWGFSIYGGGVAHLVLRDITLDGNTFEDSPSVDKEYLVPMAGIGASAGNRRFQASFAYIHWGKEFERQDENARFGALTISYFF